MPDYFNYTAQPRKKAENRIVENVGKKTEVFQWQKHAEPVKGTEITAADILGSDSTGFAQLDFGNILPFFSKLVRLDGEPFLGPNCIVLTLKCWNL